MECQSSDSKKLFKVFDAAKRKRARKKHEGYEDSNSVATDESVGVCHGNGRRGTSAKTSLQDIPAKAIDQEVAPTKRRDGVSLALKAGLVSTPRSMSPPQDADDVIDPIPKDQDSFIYAFLEEAIKRDKKKQRHAKKHEHRGSRDRDCSASRERHHHHKYRDDYKEREKVKEKPRAPPVDQGALLETFAKLCVQMSEKTANYDSKQIARTQSHKSLQCEVVSRKDSYNVEQRPVRLSREQSRDVSPAYTRSYEKFRPKGQSRENIPIDRKDRCVCCVKDKERYSSKLDVSRKTNDDYPPERVQTRIFDDEYYKSRRRDYKDYEERAIPMDTGSRYYEDRKRYCEPKTSRSFDVHNVHDDDKYRRSVRSEGVKDKEYDDFKRRFNDRQIKDRYYDERERSFSHVPKERRSRRNIERFERSSIASKDENYKDRERYSERERDSGLSVADGETSTISGRSNYLRVVKQEISEQREAMDKMMRLWKELMRCFKGVSQTPSRDKDQQESAEHMQESAAAQLRLWRECMRRYETVARDVGDTDARLMEEINKQRSEMSEMASMWQECLQRYRDMSNDFNNLKQQLATSESPTRAPQAPVVCAEGEGIPPAAPYRLPPTGYIPPMPPMPPYMNGSTLRPRASAPPAWWWGEGPQPARRRSSPDSCTSRERRHHHKDRERDSSRYKEKSKPSGARSEHRHRKR
ncbi:unnamed protein product [Pieris brassicae]|uniref:Uncharacterized protein n=1 Tax=Pieris brassicae TaxID=7116 RepID=A0A9P0TCD5_PIEBR|nr:unnamed protein product [Pieris brassicae]